MKTKSLKLPLLLGAALAAMNLAAFAGPSPWQNLYVPLKSKKELAALRPGTQVAHECPHCGTIAVSKMDKAKTQAESFTCPMCKMKITYRDAGGGKGPRTSLIDCVDVKTGKKMTARVCAVHK